MTCVRDRFWVWGHQEGSHNALFGLPGSSRMTPAEAAYYLGVPNALMVTFGGQPVPPFTREARALSPLQQVVWSIVGDSSSTRNDSQTDLDAVLALAADCPNITGAIMDDFFHQPDATGAFSRYTADDLQQFGATLQAAARPLDLWVVLYRHDLALPVQAHLAACDVVSYWTWESANLAQLETDFPRVEAVAPAARKVLGCYMWDYHAEQEIPLALMQHQCEVGLRWLREGRIDGMIFLASCLCDLGLEAVEWTRQWIAEVGDTPL